MTKLLTRTRSGRNSYQLTQTPEYNQSILSEIISKFRVMLNNIFEELVALMDLFGIDHEVSFGNVEKLANHCYHSITKKINKKYKKFGENMNDHLGYFPKVMDGILRIIKKSEPMSFIMMDDKHADDKLSFLVFIFNALSNAIDENIQIVKSFIEFSLGSSADIVPTLDVISFGSLSEKSEIRQLKVIPKNIQKAFSVIETLFLEFCNSLVSNTISKSLLSTKPTNNDDDNTNGQLDLNDFLGELGDHQKDDIEQIILNYSERRTKVTDRMKLVQSNYSPWSGSDVIDDLIHCVTEWLSQLYEEVKEQYSVPQRKNLGRSSVISKPSKKEKINLVTLARHIEKKCKILSLKLQKNNLFINLNEDISDLEIIVLFKFSKYDGSQLPESPFIGPRLNPFLKDLDQTQMKPVEKLIRKLRFVTTIHFNVLMVLKIEINNIFNDWNKSFAALTKVNSDLEISEDYVKDYVRSIVGYLNSKIQYFLNVFSQLLDPGWSLLQTISEDLLNVHLSDLTKSLNLVLGHVGFFKPDKIKNKPYNVEITMPSFTAVWNSFDNQIISLLVLNIGLINYYSQMIHTIG